GGPGFALNENEMNALRALVAGLPAPPSSTPRDTLAADTMRRLNCFGCHTRDGAGGTRLGSQVAAFLADDRSLGALKGRLTPPDLTAVGDKLRPDYLSQAIRGQAPTARPWLTVRMPVFPYAKGEAEAIVGALQSHDRSKLESEEAAHKQEKHTSTAAALIGQRGFGCVSCHVLDGKIPPGGEAETLGPDLALAHRRMAEHYFE